MAPQRLALVVQAAMVGQVETRLLRASSQMPQVALAALVVQAALALTAKVPVVMAARAAMRLRLAISVPMRKVALEAQVALAVIWEGPVVQGEMRSRLILLHLQVRTVVLAALAAMPPTKVV